MDAAALKAQLVRVNKAFYQRIFDDPWLSQMFQGVRREHIENQQTDFILSAFGGPKFYYGKSPADAHPHIFVNEQIWQRREQYLKEAFVETNFPPEYAQRWLKIDEAFKARIMKRSLDDCTRRYRSDDILYFPNPPLERKAS